MTRIILVITLISGTAGVGGFAFYFVGVDTLMFSEIIGQTDNPYMDFFIEQYDFDTGLTRWDINNLSNKKEYWLKRIREVNSITNQKQQMHENEKLFSEMMQDPSMKKIAHKIFGLGEAVITLFFEAL